MDHQWAMPDRSDGEHPLYALASTADPACRPPILGHLSEASRAGARLRDDPDVASGQWPGLVRQLAAVSAVLDEPLTARPAVRRRPPSPCHLPGAERSFEAPSR